MENQSLLQTQKDQMENLYQEHKKTNNKSVDELNEQIKNLQEEVQNAAQALQCEFPGCIIQGSA